MVSGTQPTVSNTPFIVALTLAPMPPKFISILTAASLQPPAEPLVVAHTPGVVGKKPDVRGPPQLAHIA